MAENNRNQGQTSGSSTQQNQDMSQDNQKQNTSNRKEQDQNPQGGSQWSNYRTREMSDEGYSGENIQSQESE
jgi:hypothetical protein